VSRADYDDRERPECSEHHGHDADRCEPCEAREVCDACGGSRVVEAPAPGRPYSLKTICFCDDEPAAAVAAE
jgi:hypothetical protein